MALSGADLVHTDSSREYAVPGCPNLGRPQLYLPNDQAEQGWTAQFFLFWAFHSVQFHRIFMFVMSFLVVEHGLRYCLGSHIPWKVATYRVVMKQTVTISTIIFVISQITVCRISFYIGCAKSKYPFIILG